MSVFVELAKAACREGKMDCQDNLTQPNWIRLMMGMDLIDVSNAESSAENAADSEEDLEEVLDEINNPTADKKEVVAPIDKSIIESFLRQWMRRMRGKEGNDVMPTICRTLINIGESNYVNNNKYPFDFWENFIVNYSLIDCNIKVLLAYKGNTDNSWSSYFKKYISTIIKVELGGIVKLPHLIKKSTFIYRVAPDETITIFSKTADVSCIKDTTPLQLKVNNKVVASLIPRSGLTFKCDKKIFPSDKALGTLETLDLSLVIKNFKTGSKASSYAYEYEHSQFLATELFKDCKHLYKVELSDYVQVVEYDCFAGCSKMKQLKVPFVHLIEGESNYKFKIVSREPLPERKEADDDKLKSDNSNEDFYQPTADTSDIDNNTSDLPDSFSFDNAENNMEDEEKKKNDYREGTISVTTNMPGDSTQTIEEFNDGDDIKLCLYLMPNKLHSEILYYTFYDLPDNVKDVHIDKNDNVAIEDVAKYLTSIHPNNINTNWYAEKLRAKEEFRKVYLIYSKWTKWKLSRSNKIKEAIAILNKDNRIGPNDIRVLGLLLSGNTFTQIAEIKNVDEMELRTRGLSRAFSLLYDFMK